MRKVLFFVFSALLWAGCQPSSNIADTIAKSKPIMPIRMLSDTTHIVLTDYVPVLYGDTTLWDGLQWTTGESLECINLIGTPKVVREMDIVNRDRSIHAMTFHDKSGSFAIPVLPNKPVRQALISLGYENDILRIGFYDTVANPSFEAFVQNSLIDHSLWQEEPDGTWTLDLKGLVDERISGLEGRSYLRIFAEDETYLFNDMLLPLQDGKIVTDASQLDRHDPQAQVLYSLLVDRFYDGNTSNNWKMNSQLEMFSNPLKRPVKKMKPL